MDFITQEDLNLIQEHGNQDYEAAVHGELKQVYKKLDYLCKQIAKRGFDYSIRMDPRKQAGRGVFKFQEYHWAQLFPKGLKKHCDKKFGYIVGLSDSLHFHMMGFTDFQNHPLSKKSSKKCWTEVPIDGTSYEGIADEFEKFDTKYRPLLIATGAEMGIEELKRIKSEQEMDSQVALLQDKKQIVLQGPPGTGKTYSAKDIAEKIIFDEISVDKNNQKKNLESTNRFKLLQFHPSYTYDDFVRGIVVKSTEEKGIEYVTKNKVFGQLCTDALENFNAYHNNPELVRRRNWVDEKFDSFIDFMENQFNTNQRIDLTDNIYIINIDDDGFRYKGDDWNTPSRVNFFDLLELIEANLDQPLERLVIDKDVSVHATYRKTYYRSVLKKFFEHSGKYESDEDIDVQLKNFVLIIDEMNRANLPSVLGELIYGLEYRGEAIETMYEINGSNKLVIPPNLFIIGTMNTADRSVGHIDYAIRRRFAFINVLPKSHVIATTDGQELFKKVEELFVQVDEEGAKSNSEQLAPDFNYSDVQLGHSYFMGDADKLSTRLEFEIKPILREYLKDGILKPGCTNIIESLSV